MPMFTVQMSMTVTVFADGRGEARGRGARRRVVNVPKEGDACQGVILCKVLYFVAAETIRSKQAI